MIKKLINLLPYPVTLITEDGETIYFPAPDPDKAVSMVKLSGTIGTIGVVPHSPNYHVPVHSTVKRTVKNLPPIVKGVAYLVPESVCMEYPLRDDLYYLHGFDKNTLKHSFICSHFDFTE